MEGKREETARGASRPGPVSSDELDRMLASILTMPNVGGTVFDHPCYKGHAGKSLKHYFEMVASLYVELEGKPLEELETSSDSFAGNMLDFSRKLEDHLKNDTAKAFPGMVDPPVPADSSAPMASRPASCSGTPCGDIDHIDNFSRDHYACFPSP